MKKVFKRLGIAAGILFGLMVLAAILVPLFVHVDDYRPQIVAAANDKINGKLELGKLSLSLWGQIRIQVDGFTLSDAQGRKVVAGKDVYFHLPFLSLLSGSPVLIFKMDRPEVSVIKDKTGKMNVLTLVKPAVPGAAPAPAPAPGAPAGNTGGGMSLPGIATRARLGVELKNALVQYRDETTQLTTDVRDLNVQVKDISLSHPMQIAVWADLDTKMGKTLTVKGPARFTAEALPVVTGTKFEAATGSFKVDLDKLDIAMGELFHKGKQIPANAEGKFAYRGTSAMLEGLVLRFHNAEISAAGGAKNLDDASGPSLALTVKSNPIPLKPWNELVPMLKEYDLGGTASLDAQVTGTASAPRYEANLEMKTVTAKAPMLKAQPTLNARVHVITDQVENLTLTMKAPGTDLSVRGKVVSFTKPNVTIQVLSPGMDLDQLVDFPKPAAKGEGKTETAESAPAKGKDGKPADFDALLDPLRENPVLGGLVANIGWQLNSLKAKGVRMTNVDGKASFRDLTMALESFKLGVFGGSVEMGMAAALKPKTPTYRFHAAIANLDLREAVASQMEMFKNTLLGKASFKMDGTGASFNPEPAQKNLNAKGSMSVVQATFATLDIGKMAADAISKSLAGIAAKVPGLAGQKLPAPGSIDNKYESITADFTIAGGYFSSPNFYAKSIKAIDLKGDTKVGLLDKSLKANWQVIDTYNVTHARDLTVDQGGVRVEHVLAEGNNPVTFPVVVGGTIFAPQPSYTAVPEALGKVALNNATEALKSKAKAEAQRAAEEQLKKMNAPAPIQNAVKDLGKKLFGH